MKSQMARGPDAQRPARSAKAKKYVKQTAHFEGRRDGKPIVFGWGGHLSRHQKSQLAHRAIWSITILLVAIVIFVLVGFWVNINIVVPNKTISSVNGQNIPQSDYHKMTVFRGELYNNLLNGVHGLIAQRDALQSEINSATDDTQKINLNNQLQALTDPNNPASIPSIQNLFVQSPLGNEAIGLLQDDIVLRTWLSTPKGSAIQQRINPSDAAITKAMNDFKAKFPRGFSYNSLLSQNGVSDDDMRAMMAIKLRRDNMQKYLASLITSPTRQVRARIISVATPADAQNIIKQVQGGADFGQLAANQSLDNNTKANGGELGWLASGQYTLQSGNLRAVIDNWLSNPARKPGDLSPDLNENGTDHVVQIEEVDPSRTVDPDVLQQLQNNALIGWLLSQKEAYQITVPDPGMLSDPMNIPSFVPVSAPQQSTQPPTA